MRTCSPDEVRVTTHALLLQLARTSDAAAFPDEMKGALALAMMEAGVTPETSRSEWDEAVARYIATRAVRDDMLQALSSFFLERRNKQRR